MGEEAEDEMPQTPEPEEEVDEEPALEAEPEEEFPADEEEMPLGDEEDAEADGAGDEGAPADEDEEEFVGNMIEELGHGDKYVVRMRQGLRTPALASKFIAEMGELIDSRKAEDKTTVFEDFDISQNLIPFEQFEDMFGLLADSQVQVERFRAFGCPTINDDVALVLAGWLSSLANEMAPFEMHLSDCAIQTQGFLELAKAFEENDAFPPLDSRFPEKGKVPLYLRLENNYIKEEAIQEKCDEGIIVTMRKSDRPRYNAEHKIRILVREDGSFAQKDGQPPAPEDAPPPKRVQDGKGKDGKGKAKGKGKGAKDKDRYRDSKGRDSVGKGRDGKGRDSGGKGKGSRDSGGKGKDTGRSSTFGSRPAPHRDSSRDAAPWDRRDSTSRAAPARSFPERRGDDRRPSAYERAPVRDSRYDRPERDRGNYNSRPAGQSSARSEPPSRQYNAFDRGAQPSSGRHSPAGAARTSATPSSARRGPAGATVESRSAPKRPMSVSDFDDTAKRQRTQATPFRPSHARPADDRAAPRSTGASRPGGQSKGQSKGGDRLPPSWEKHFSKDFNLDYYWNSKTGDSSWEKPV